MVDSPAGAPRRSASLRSRSLRPSNNGSMASLEEEPSPSSPRAQQPGSSSFDKHSRSTERPSRKRISWTGGVTENTLLQFLGLATKPMEKPELRTPGSIRIDSSDIAVKVKNILQKFDVNKDDTLDIHEVTALVEHLLKEERNSRNLRYAIFGLVTFTVVLLAAMTGLTYAVVASMKDTKIRDNNVLITTSGNIVQVASADTVVIGGALMQRQALTSASSDAGSGRRLQGTRDGGSGAMGVVRTAAHTGVQQKLTSAMDINDLIELNYLHVDSPSGGQIALKVSGVARVPAPQSLYGSVLNILTVAGTVVLDGDLISYEEQMEPVFRNAGFLEASSSSGYGAGRRRLLDASAQVSGLYNREVSVPELTPPQGLAPPKSWLVEAGSKLGAQSASAQLQELYESGAEERKWAAMWQDYKKTFGKSYASIDEDLDAFRIWMKNARMVLDTNYDPTLDHWASLNEFSDMKAADVEAYLLNKTPPPNVTAIEEKYGSTRRRHLLQGDPEPPKKVNWTAAGKVTEIKKQGSCGSCWAFAGSAVLESALLIAHPSLNVSTMDLSEQHIVDCVNPQAGSAYVSNGCDGGDPFEVLTYAYSFNVTTEKVYPYASGFSGKTGRCDVATLRSTRPSEVVQTASDALYVYPWLNEKALMLAVAEQPIACYWMADSSFLNYAGGIYSPTTCTSATNHNMLIVGYDTTGPVPFWIIKNQWGTRWGEQGYTRVKMTGDGDGPCGMYTFSAFPPLEFVKNLQAKTGQVQLPAEPPSPGNKPAAAQPPPPSQSESGNKPPASAEPPAPKEPEAPSTPAYPGAPPPPKAKVKKAPPPPGGEQQAQQQPPPPAVLVKKKPPPPRKLSPSEK